MSSLDTYSHVRAESPFVDDLPEPANILHLAVFSSPVAHGRIINLDITGASDCPGVIAIFTATDIPGENQIGSIIPDEPLLAEREVHYAGQPVAVIAAETKRQAGNALKYIRYNIEELTPVLDPRQAANNGDLIAPSRSLSCGDIDTAWQQCSTIITGRADTGGQEHLYLETQSAMVIPEARNRLKVYSSTQSPAAIQRGIAKILNLKMNDIEVDVQRLGGAFGGKEDQATAWASIAALVAYKMQRPAKIILTRHDDIIMTGKRHPYSTDFKLGLDEKGKFIAFEATYYQNSGAAADLSTAIMERTLFHATNAYYIPNVRITGLCCRTNLPPFTAFRGFGGPQAMFVIEAAIELASCKTGIPAWKLQELNLLDTGDLFPYGMSIQQSNAKRSFKEAKTLFSLEERLSAIENNNKKSLTEKRGLAIMPICFGISFTNKGLNQAGALVHIYTDGSVIISTGAVEMGQGVFSKIRSIAAKTFGIDESLINIESTNTSRIANMSPTAASTATDLNGMATYMACNIILSRLKNVAGKYFDTAAENVSIKNSIVSSKDNTIPWRTLIDIAYWQRVDLSAHSFYATPNIDYDKEHEKGTPFAYHVFGTAIVEATVDILRGTAKIDSVNVIHDAGRSLNLLIDRGQAEGAIVQGIGWLTMEELIYNDNGQLLSNALATYKIPDLHFAPKDINVIFLANADNPNAVLQTKGIGEPPFMYGIGAYFAIRNAIKAATPLSDSVITAPITNEQILSLLDKTV